MTEMTKEQAAMVLDPESSEEAMEEIKRLSGYNGEDMELKVIRDACRVAVKVLRAPGLPEPMGEPLTLEQLREMDGKPVWIKNLEEPEKSQWRLCHWDRGKYLVLQGISVRGYLLDDYGVAWLAYAYPPAHIDREAWSAEWEHFNARDVGNIGCSKCGYAFARLYPNKFCPTCGRATTPEALAELEKRLRG